MKKKTLTRKEIEKAIGGLSNNDQILYNKILQIENLLGLYYEDRKDTEEFNKFVTSKAEELERHRSENKEGA